VAHAEQQRHRLARDALAGVGEEAQRHIVRPLGVVDEQHERAASGEAGDEPVQPVHHGVQVALGTIAPARIQHRLGVPRGPGEQLGPIRWGQRPERRLQQRTRHAEREAALELGAARREHPRSRRHRPLGGGAQQRRLADARRTGHDRHAAACQRVAQLR
jgi:hypothetical protein